jgi:hypothetical protein
MLYLWHGGVVMRKYFQLILILIVLGIGSHLVICNVEHIMFLNSKKYVYNFKDSREIQSIKKSLLSIETNLLKIDNLEDSYLSDEELNTIKNDLKITIEVVNSLDFWKYNKSNYSMNQVELSKLIQNTQQVGVLSSIEIYKILLKYNSSLNLDKFIDYSLIQLLPNNNVDMLLFNNYKYISDNISIENNDVSVTMIMNILSMKLNTMEYVSNLALESGDMNE